MSEFKFKQFTIQQEGAPFKVGTDSMILGAWTELNGGEAVLDIGTGTGILALMLAQKLTSGKVLATEPNRDAFEIAIQNFNNSPFSSKLIGVNEALQNLKPNSKLDVIVCNPPYFSDSTLSSERDVSARHTVDLSFNDIVEFSENYIASSGKVSIVLPVKEFSEFKNQMKSRGFFESKRLEVSSFENTKIKRVCAEFRKQGGVLETGTLSIRNSEDNSYSDEYKSLVSDFQIRF